MRLRGLVFKGAKKVKKEMAKKLKEVGWHVSNPKQNGLVIPEKLPNGTDFFHANHPAYNEWMGKIGELIVIKGEKNQILKRMEKLNKLTTELLEKAYKEKSSINNYWKNTVDEISLKDIDDVIL